MTQLTAFQFDILAAVRRLNSDAIGLDVKQKVGDINNERIEHARFYQNLTQLEDQGLITRTHRDGRSKYCELTDDGRTALSQRLQTLSGALQEGSA